MNIKKTAKIKNIVYQVVEFFYDLLFPKRCVECQKPGLFVCYECFKKIKKIFTSVCQKCGKISEHGKYCTSCRKGLFIRGVTVACDYYEGPVREMIHHLKYSGYIELSDILGELLVEAISKQNYKNIIVVPVPLARKKEAQRGFNQSELLARYVSKKLGFRGGLALLKKKDTKPQMKLSRKDRLINLQGVFTIADKSLIFGKKVLLIDDVMTTNATLNECARVLKESGAREVWGAVIAKG